MKKIIRLTETQLAKLVKKVKREMSEQPSFLKQQQPQVPTGYKPQPQPQVQTVKQQQQQQPTGYKPLPPTGQPQVPTGYKPQQVQR